MIEPKPAPAGYDVALADVDAASRIVLEHLNRALAQIHASKIEPGAAVQAAVQMCMRLYADLIDDDAEAIRQLRQFLDQWQADVLVAAAAATH